LELATVNIGYAFANVLLRRDNGKLSVDVKMLNDVVEQNGGGGEPFTCGSDLLDDAVGAAAKAANTAQTIVQDRIIGTAEDTVERVKAKAVQFKDMATRKGGLDSIESEELDSETSGATRPGVKKHV
jgi:hypothetical protein